MNKSFLILFVALIAPFLLTSGSAAEAEDYPPGYYQVADQWSYELLPPQELDDLLAPIALYPDPLIAQILPAATFIEQIGEAARYVRRYGPARVDYQPWDLSVRAIAHYPKVLYMMEKEYEWTAALGQAFIEQPQDVMDAVQRLRDYAWAQGNLYSTSEQEVVYETGVIRIVPARPQYVYIPVYDPYVVYAEPYSPSYPFVTFSVGFTIGAWLNRDCDWRQRRVYYHGWRGSRWVDRARPHVRDRRGIYITPRASTINVNTRVIERDTRVYRQQLRSEGVRRRQDGRFPSAPIRTQQPRPGRIERPAPGRTQQQRPATIEQRRRERIEQRPGGERLERKSPPPRQQAPAATGRQAPAATGRQAPAAKGRQAPAATGRQAPAATGRQAPAATGQQRQPAREGQGGERRREPRQINRPPATGTAPSAVPAPVVPQAPARVIQTPPATAPTVVPAPRVPAPTVVPAPRAPAITTPAPSITTPPPATRTPAPSVTPAPGPSGITVPRAAEPAAPSRPAREQQPGSGRGRSTDGPSGPRAAPREGR